MVQGNADETRAPAPPTSTPPPPPPPPSSDPITHHLPPALAARVLWLAARASAPRAAETSEAARALCSAAAVCQSWRGAAERDDALWRQAYACRFAPPAGAVAAGLPPLASPLVSPAPTPSPSPRPPGAEEPPPPSQQRPPSPFSTPLPSPRERYPSGGSVEAWLQGGHPSSSSRAGGRLPRPPPLARFRLETGKDDEDENDSDDDDQTASAAKSPRPPPIGAFARTDPSPCSSSWRHAYAQRHALDAAWRRLSPRAPSVLAPLGGAGSRFNAARFGGRGRVVVAGCADGTVGVYCARTGRPRAALLLGGFGGGGGGSSGLGDGGSGSDRPASAARRQSLFPPPSFPLSPWAQQRLLRQRQRQRAEHAAAVWCVDAGDELAASGGVDSQARVWSLRTGATLLRLRHVAGGGDDGEAVTSVRVLERASAVLTSHARGLVALWDVRVGAPPVRLLHLSGAPGTRYARTLPDLRAQMLRPTACYCAQVDGDGDGEGGGVGGGGAAGGVTVVAGGQGGRLHLFDLRQGAKVARVDGAHEGDVLSMHLSAGRVVTGAKDGSLKLWDLSRLRALGGGGGEVLAGGSALVPPTPRGSGVSSPNRAHAAYIASRAPSPAPSDADDGNGSGGTHGCPCVALSYEHDADVFSCRLAGSGDWRVASASEDGTVKIWDAEAAAAAGGGGGSGGVGCGGGVGRAGARRRRRQRRAAWRAYGLAAGGDDSDGDEGEGEDDDDDDGRCCREWRSLATLRPAADGDPRLLSLMLPPPPLPPLPLATAQLAALGIGGGGGNGAAAMAPGAGAAAGALPPLPAVLPMQRGPGVHCVDICDDRMVVGGNDALLRIYAFGSAAEEDEEDEDEDDDEG